MTETDRIKNALVNVITLATHSDYYNKDRDHKDIDLISDIVNRAIPIKPLVNNNALLCGWCFHPMNIGYCYCIGKGKKPYIVRTDSNCNYCEYCGIKIDWSAEE